MKRFFLRNVSSGEPAYFCGSEDDLDDVIRSIGNFLKGDIPELLLRGDEHEDYRLEVKEMTDEEVAAIPDI